MDPPAEETGAGKQILLDKGAYENMDVCIMYVVAHFLPPLSRARDRQFSSCNASGATPWQATRLN